MIKRCCAGAAFLLALTALWLLFSHAPLFRQEYRLEASQAAERAGERMAVVMPDGPVNVNLAGMEELEMLPEIGPVMALRIMEEREQNGPFFYPEDLLSVRGIGEKTLQKILSLIHLN